ncbi:Abi-alpha family protein [Lactococcus lactis]|uniref:Abi-alpha family protein n=1 Tax=Lactococcus lactis TaxID=1358 RepID=UPI00189755B4|nr:Abi-alpha family protein [Lactococcus lactis]
MNDIKLDVTADLNPIVDRVNEILTPISSGFAGIFAYVFHKPREYKIINDIHLEELANLTRDKTDKIPDIYKDFSDMVTIGKILEDSIYQLSNSEFRELYSSLVAASINKSKNVKPFYSSLLRELSQDEVNLFQYMMDFSFLYEVKISSDNPLFVTENTYKYYWEPKYFKLNGIFEHNALRNFSDKSWESIHNEDEFYQDHISDSLNILVSKGLIEKSQSNRWDEFIPSIKKYAFENDKTVIKLQNENKDLIHPISFNTYGAVFTLTNLGKSLKTILNDSHHEDLR